MRAHLVGLLSAVLSIAAWSGVARAQPGPDQTPPLDPPPVGPFGPNAGPPPPAPPPFFAPEYALHRGVTAEASVGVGYARFGASSAGDSVTVDTNASLVFAVGIGGWLMPRLSLTGRFSTIFIHDHDDLPSGGSLLHAYIGPDLAYWITPHVWLGGGLGLATLHALQVPDCQTNCATNGVGIDIRGGYAFGSSENQLDLSFELAPSFFNQNGASDTVTTLSLQIGYRFL